MTAHTFKLTYIEEYRHLAVWVRSDLLPLLLPHMKVGVTVIAMEIRSAGRCQLDGKETGFQDLRVYTTEEPAALLSLRRKEPTEGVP